MLKKIASFFYKDIGWKLLSVAAAFALWIVATTLTDPYKNQEFTATLVPTNVDILARDNISVLNLDAIANTQITVGIRIRTSEIEILADNPRLIEASIDLRNIIVDDVRESSVPIIISAPVNIDIVQLDAERQYVTPDTVTLRLDNYIKKEFDIEVSEIGEVAEGFELIETGSRDASVTLSAAKSVLDRVYEVRASVDVIDAEGSVNSTSKLTAYDRSNNDMTDEVELSITETEVSATVLPYKEVALLAEYTGEPAYNYVTTGIAVLPEKVFVVGSPEVLEETETLPLTPIDLTGLSESFEVTLDIREALPSNLRLRQGETEDAAVSVTVEPVVSREYAYPIDLLGATGYIGSGYAARILNVETVPIVVQGSETAMAAMDVSRINAQFSLRGLEVGEHEIALVVELPAGIQLMNAPTVNVEIYEIPVSEEQTEGTGEETQPEDFDSLFIIDPATGEMIGVPGGSAVTGEDAASGEEQTDDEPENNENIPEEDSPDDVPLSGDEPSSDEPLDEEPLADKPTVDTPEEDLNGPEGGGTGE